MARKPTAFDLVRPGLLAAQMIAEANFVIALRMWGMLGAWRMAPGEYRRMGTEKIAAAQESGRAVARALTSGATPAEMTSAALAPVRRRTRANAARLTRSAARGQG